MEGGTSPIVKITSQSSPLAPTSAEGESPKSKLEERQLQAVEKALQEVGRQAKPDLKRDRVLQKVRQRILPAIAWSVAGFTAGALIIAAGAFTGRTSLYTLGGMVGALGTSGWFSCFPLGDLPEASQKVRNRVLKKQLVVIQKEVGGKITTGEGGWFFLTNVPADKLEAIQPQLNLWQTEVKPYVIGK